MSHPKVIPTRVTAGFQGNIEHFSTVFPLTTHVKLRSIPGLPASAERVRVESTLLSWVSLTTPIGQPILPIKLHKFAIMLARGEERSFVAISGSPIESFSDLRCFRVSSQEDLRV